MQKIREYVLLRLTEIAGAEIDVDAIRQEEVAKRTMAIVDDLDSGGFTEADRAYVDAVLSA